MVSVFLTLYVQISVVTSCQEVNYSSRGVLKSGFSFPKLLGADYSVVISFEKKTPIEQFPEKKASVFLALYIKISVVTSCREVSLIFR